jgi:hypothetical protein
MPIDRYSATAAAASANNVILAKGQLGYTADDDVLKVGDGVRHWNDLEAVGGGGGGGGITQEQLEDFVGGMVTGNTETGITVTYDDATGKLNFVAAGGGLTPTAKTSAYTAVAGDYVIANATSAGFTVTLPASPSNGATVGVKKVDSTANIVTIAPQGGLTIDGDANATITGQWASATITYDGTRWSVIASGYGSQSPAITAAQNIYTGTTTSPGGTIAAMWTSAMDLVISATTGDLVQLGLSARASAEASWLHLDVGTLLTSGGSIVNYCSTAGSSGQGVQAWQTSADITGLSKIGGSILYTVQAGDVSSGTVRFRLLGRATATRTLDTAATWPAHFWAINLRH